MSWLVRDDLPNPSSTVLTHSEIHSFPKNKMNLTWRNPPAHHWYVAKSSGLSIHCRSSRAHQTALARFRSGHLRSMTFVQRVKSFFTCPCSLLASPAHLLDCWGISLRQLYEEQDLAFIERQLRDQSPSCRDVSILSDFGLDISYNLSPVIYQEFVASMPRRVAINFLDFIILKCGQVTRTITMLTYHFPSSTPRRCEDLGLDRLQVTFRVYTLVVF
ncbi:uncharacterized protein TNCV_2216861 [Trichonephila clavipes]|nr:uncharacterized protein TNCV_2216861 [Trichonephila clavipes]